MKGFSRMKAKRQPEPFVSLLLEGGRESAYPYFISVRTARGKYYSNVFYAVRPLASPDDMQNISTHLALVYDRQGSMIINIQPLFSHTVAQHDDYVYHLGVATSHGVSSLTITREDPILTYEDVRAVEKTCAEYLDARQAAITSMCLLSFPHQPVTDLVESRVV
jgi:hypothetical protein